MAFVELNILCPPDLSEILLAKISDHCHGFVETEEGLVAYAEESAYQSSPVSAILKEYASQEQIAFTTRVVQEENWNAIWEQSFQPVIIDEKCRIRASFHPHSITIPYEIVINPKMSFGTGHHETTGLMISLLLKLPVEGKRVLDIGCGTGILTILAEKLGASYMEAVDIEEMAVENGKENLILNKTSQAILYLGTVQDVTANNFDLILANLTKQDIVKGLLDYTQLLTEGGLLITSGFYEEDVEEVAKAAKPLGFHLQNKVSKNDWAACVYRYNSKN